MHSTLSILEMRTNSMIYLASYLTPIISMIFSVIYYSKIIIIMMRVLDITTKLYNSYR